MTDHDERLRQIEAELGRIPRDVLLRFFSRRAYVSRLAASEVNHVHVTGSTFCDKTGTWLISGTDRTDAKGERIIALNERLCFPNVPQPALFGAAQLVATAVADRPIVLTTTYQSRPSAPPAGYIPTEFWSPSAEPDLYEGRNWRYTAESPLHIDVTVRSWAIDGTPAPDVTFAWICTVEGSQLVHIGG